MNCKETSMLNLLVCLWMVGKELQACLKKVATLKWDLWPRTKLELVHALKNTTKCTQLLGYQGQVEGQCTVPPCLFFIRATDNWKNLNGFSNFLPWLRATFSAPINSRVLDETFRNKYKQLRFSKHQLTFSSLSSNTLVAFNSLEDNIRNLETWLVGQRQASIENSSDDRSNYNDFLTHYTSLLAATGRPFDLTVKEAVTILSMHTHKLWMSIYIGRVSTSKIPLTLSTIITHSIAPTTRQSWQHQGGYSIAS